METIEKPINEQESLKLIHDMIHLAQKRFDDESFMFLLWGWIATIAFLLGYIWIMLNKSEYIGLTWAVLGSAGGIVSGIYNRKKSKEKMAVTYMDEYMKYTWIAYLVAYFMVLIAMISLKKFDLINPLCLMIIGIPTFITGGLIKFRPLVYGGIIFWIGGALTFVFRTEWQFMICAITMICGYLIPGYQLKASHKNETV